jgi:hypothetical protein
MYLQQDSERTDKYVSAACASLQPMHDAAPLSRVTAAAAVWTAAAPDGFA